MADDKVKDLEEKYKDRIDPSEKDINEKGIVPLTAMEKAGIQQGIDPEDMHHTAGKTTRNGLMQEVELKKVAEEGDKAANISPAEDREGVQEPQSKEEREGTKEKKEAKADKFSGFDSKDKKGNK